MTDEQKWEEGFEEWVKTHRELLLEPFDIVDVKFAIRMAWLESRRRLKDNTT